jgi:glycosyltransferase involved in cell wall biosynthesis
LNILFVADVSIKKVIGGAERVLYEQTTRLVRRGHNVFIMTRRLPGHDKNYECIQGVSEYRYNCSKRNAILFLFSTLKNSKKLFEKLQHSVKFDCINLYQPFSAFGVVRSPLSKHIKKNYVCFSLSFEEYISRNKKFGGPLKRWFYNLNIFVRKWLEKKNLKNSDQIIVLSEYTKTTLWSAHKLPLNNVSIVPGGVDLERFIPAPDSLEIRRNLNMPNNRIILFTVRNLVQRMGLENLINAIKIVIKNVPDISLIIGGDGVLKSELIKLSRKLNLKGYIKFAGFIPEKQLPDYYNMADLFVLPTKELEGFGLVTLEALASGLPVVGTPVGGTEEILGKFDSRFVFKGTDPESMAELITEKCHLIKHSPQRWREISYRCRRYVEDNYSWEKNLDTFEELFKKTLQN